MKLELQATPEEVMRAVDVLQELGATWQLAPKELFGLALALEECGSNIVNHALQGDPQQRFQVSFHLADNCVIIELRDAGPAFDPTHAPESPLMADDELPPGGWGIQLVRRYIDAVHYTRQAGENILRLTKHIASEISLPIPIQPPTFPAMPLDILIQKPDAAHRAGTVTVYLTGSLDTATAPELERQLGPLLASSVKDIVFDLAQLKFISSAGLRVFSVARKLLKERNGQASFIHLQPQIQEVFEIIQALPGMAIFKNEAEFDRYLALQQQAHQG